MKKCCCVSGSCVAVDIVVQTVTGGGGAKKRAAGVKGKKPAAEKEEPMEKELSVSCILSQHCLTVTDENASLVLLLSSLLTWTLQTMHMM